MGVAQQNHLFKTVLMLAREEDVPQLDLALHVVLFILMEYGRQGVSLVD